jgi:hypothetical protein
MCIQTCIQSGGIQSIKSRLRLGIVLPYVGLSSDLDHLQSYLLSTTDNHCGCLASLISAAPAQETVSCTPLGSGCFHSKLRLHQSTVLIYS